MSTLPCSRSATTGGGSILARPISPHGANSSPANYDCAASRPRRTRGKVRKAERGVVRAIRERGWQPRVERSSRNRRRANVRRALGRQDAGKAGGCQRGQSPTGRGPAAFSERRRPRTRKASGAICGGPSRGRNKSIRPQSARRRTTMRGAYDKARKEYDELRGRSILTTTDAQGKKHTGVDGREVEDEQRAVTLAWARFMTT